MKQKILPWVFISLLIASCNTQSSAERKLNPPKSVKDFRIDDISKQVKDDPAKAIHLLEIYDILYGTRSQTPNNFNSNDQSKLIALREEAESTKIGKRLSH